MRTILQHKTLRENRKLIREFKQEMVEVLENATQDRSIINNINRMIGVYERYGYDKRYVTFKNTDAQFICIEEGGAYVVVTCYESSRSDKEAIGKYRKHRF
jgi:hypothetical protein